MSVSNKEENKPELSDQDDEENKNLDSSKKDPKKKPKKKKLSKKELARIKKEKAEQERLEQERKDAERRALQEQEEESRKRREQQQRLIEEDEDIHKLRIVRGNRGGSIVNERQKEEDWTIFQHCDHAVDVRSESDVNTFISQWTDIDETDLNVLFERIHLSNLIQSQLLHRSQVAEIQAQTKEYERCIRQIGSLKEIISSKIEAITVHHLVFSDKYAGAKNEVQLQGSADDLSYGMWVNLSKNPRIKDVNLCTGVSIEIPKAVAMSSIAIRALRISERPFDEKYLFIDRLLQIDFFQLPAPPKRIGSLTLRQMPQKNGLVQLSYPLRNVTAAQPPLAFRVQLDPISIGEHTSDATVVMLSGGKIVTSHISKVAFEQNEVVFSTMSIGTFGIAVPRFRHFPFQFWEISAVSPTSVEIYIRTALLELAFYISEDGLVSMESPFEFSGLTPIAAIDYLMQRGINIVSPSVVEGIVPKQDDVEQVLHNGIADCAVGFVISWSKWNSALPPDRAMLLVREQPEFHENEDDDKKPLKAILVKALHVTEVPNTEELEECSQKPLLEESRIHQHLLPMFFDGASEIVKKRVRNSPTFLCNTVLYFMKKMRLFSMTQ